MQTSLAQVKIMKIVALAVLFLIFSKCDAEESDYIKKSTCKVSSYTYG